MCEELIIFWVIFFNIRKQRYIFKSDIIYARKHNYDKYKKSASSSDMVFEFKIKVSNIKFARKNTMLIFLST